MMSLPSRASVNDQLRSSFQFKLFSLFTLLTAVITILFVAVFVVHRIREDRRHAAEKLLLVTKGLADTVRLPLYAENRELLQRYAQEALRLPQIRAVEIASANDRLVIRLPGVCPADGNACLEKTVEVRSIPPVFLQEAGANGGDEQHGDLIGRVKLCRSTADLNQAWRRFVATACGLALLFWFLVSGSCYLLLRRVTRSFQTLMRGLQNLHGGDYFSRIEVDSADEPGRASAFVNQLAETLAQRDAENRRLHDELKAAIELEVASRERVVAINESLEQEIELKDQVKQELKNLVEQLPVGIVWSNGEGRIELLNSFMLERIGHSTKEAATVEVWWELACPDGEKRRRIFALRERALEAWRAGEVFFYDAQVLCRDGSLRELHCSNQLAGERTVDIMIDMTERELLQRQLIRNQKLESIGILAGGIAHNFNNALTGVLGYISFARKFVAEGDRVHALLVDAERATGRAAGFAGELLTFANGGQPVMRAVSVVKLADESVALATSGSKVTGQLRFPERLPLVMVDDRQIAQAFNCICLNAVQSMPEGGVLTVRGREVEVQRDGVLAARAGRYVEISFEDEGCGISDEDKPNIFTPYFTTKAEIGSGLGLATVHSILTRHGGSITFSTMVGRGTTFTLYLPVAGSQPAAASPREGAATCSLKA